MIVFRVISTRVSKPREQGGETSNEVKGNNSGPQIGSVHGSVVNIGNSVQHDLVIPVLGTQQEPAWPSLVLEQFAKSRCRYEPFSGKWNKSSVGEEVLLVRVLNPIPQGTKPGRNLKSLYAVLRFTGENNVTIQVDNAYWIGKSANKCDLEIGNHSLLLLGRYDNGEWITYHNRYSRSLMPNWNRGNQNRDLETELTFSKWSSLGLEICVMSPEAGHCLVRSSFTLRKHPEVGYVVETT